MWWPSSAIVTGIVDDEPPRAAAPAAAAAAPPPLPLPLLLELCATGLTAVILPSTSVAGRHLDRHVLADHRLALEVAARSTVDDQLGRGRLEDRLAG